MIIHTDECANAEGDTCTCGALEDAGYCPVCEDALNDHLECVRCMAENAIDAAEAWAESRDYDTREEADCER